MELSDDLTPNSSEWLDQMSSGTTPTMIMKRILSENPSFSTDDLVYIFSNEFPKAPIAAIQTIWYWNYPGRNKGISDQEADDSILYELKLAGYI